MLKSGERNENGDKITIGLISKKATLHVEHTCIKTSDKKYRSEKNLIKNRTIDRTNRLDKNIGQKYLAFKYIGQKIGKKIRP